MVEQDRASKDRGFELQFTGRFTAEYREGGRVTKLHLESVQVRARHGVAVSEASLQPLWMREPEASREGERRRVLKNVREAIEFQDLAFELL